MILELRMNEKTFCDSYDCQSENGVYLTRTFDCDSCTHLKLIVEDYGELEDLKINDYCELTNN